MVIVFERGIWRRWLPVLLAFVPLILFVYLGQFSRMMSDDYCTIAVGQELGAWEGMRYWFDNWAGSYANFFLKSAVAPLDVILPRVMPAVIVVLWLAGLYWLLAQVLAWLPVDSPRRWAAAISALTIAAAINAFHSPQSFYWYAASTHYALPLAVLTLYAALALWTAQRAALSSAALLVGGLLCFISAGAAEIFVAFQAVFLSCCLLMALLLVRPAQRLRYVLVFGAGWLATLISLIIQVNSPGVANRIAVDAQNIGQPIREMTSLLAETANLTFQHIGHPPVFAAFALLMGIGLLAAPTKSQAQSTAALPLPAWLGFGLLVQLLFVPLLWAHTSDSPQLLGRFSLSYSVVICLNAAFILCFAALIWQRRRINAHLQRRAQRRLLFCLALLMMTLPLFALTQLRGIHYRAASYLFLSALTLLVILGAHLPGGALHKRSGLLAYGIAAICTAAVIGTALFGRGFVTPRVLAPGAFLLVISGLVWGGCLGCQLKSGALPPAGIRWLERAGCVLILTIGIGIVLGQARLIPDFYAYAVQWDARHQSIIAQRDSGQTPITTAPLQNDLADYVQVTTMADDPTNRCAERYYGVDAIIVTAS